MKKILILYPHFPPSNLAGVHRSRLFAMHLPSFGWEPIILTVHEMFYEEEPDWNLVKLLPVNLRIEKVSAFPITTPRFIGDIGLRAFIQLYKKGKAIINSERIDFLYIPIPSFYCALLGRLLHNKTGVKYGIDYIDPWVHDFPGSKKLFSRHWFSTKIAEFLEPFAIKKASLITGVGEGYYSAVLERNPTLKESVICGAMPYGGEKSDHAILNKLDIKPYLFSKKSNKFQMVYAGAMLPKAYAPLEAIFKSIAVNPEIFSSIEIHFIGTGKLPNDPEGFNIRNLALQYGLWQTVVFEYPKRIPYLDVLLHLNLSNGIFILGSTEPHYTPSKTYQGVLSSKPLLAVLHKESTAVNVILQANAGSVLAFNGEAGIETIEREFVVKWEEYFAFAKKFNPTDVKMEVFQEFSAYATTSKLANLLNRVYAR